MDRGATRSTGRRCGRYDGRMYQVGGGVGSNVPALAVMIPKRIGRHKSSML